MESSRKMERTFHKSERSRKISLFKKQLRHSIIEMRRNEGRPAPIPGPVPAPALGHVLVPAPD